MAGHGKSWSYRADVLIARCGRTVWEALVTHGRLMAGEMHWSHGAMYPVGPLLGPRLDAPPGRSPESLPVDVSVAELEEMLRRE
ncbi:hypothetical protein ACIRO1_46625 [Streptomyces sp. NPDC102381]|uniref:hypothetical protein n=1 Tax=Streptomyces sp. NPDC102381 TaxID=3366164 RepID=UPI0038103833